MQYLSVVGKLFFVLFAAILFGSCASGSSPGQECEEGFIRCKGICVDPESNVYNCGSCGNECGQGEVCSGGECSLSCPSGLENCNGSCVNTQNDSSNCGSCGNECGQGEVCSEGECKVSCPSGLENCNGSCVNTQTDSSNCGSCGNACSQGEVCENGVCVLSCPPGFEECNGSCVNTQNDHSNCGSCGNACASNETCESGVCTPVSTCDPTQNIALIPGTTASSSGGGTGEWGPHKMIDGFGEAHCSTQQFHWVLAGSSPGGEWIQMNFTSPQVVGRIFIDTANAWSEICSSGTGRTLAGATIQWWNGSSWVTDGSVSGRTDDWSYVFSSPVETTRIRLYNIYATDVIFQRSNPIIAEWEVYCN